MTKRIKNIHLVNLQSWEGENIIELPLSQLTVLKAPSETGKSTLPRFFIRFCTSQNSGKDYSDLIRDGEKAGAVIIEYNTNERILFMLSGKTKVLGIENEKRELICSFTDDEITESVLESAGIIADLKNNILLNVISRDLPLFPIATSPIFNGEVISRVLMDREVENALENLKFKEGRLDSIIKDNTQKKDAAIQACNHMRRIDVERLKQYKYEVDRIRLPVTFIELLDEKTNKFLEVSYGFESNIDYPGQTRKLNAMLKITSGIYGILKELNVVSTMPSKTFNSIEHLDIMIILIDNLKKLYCVNTTELVSVPDETEITKLLEVSIEINKLLTKVNNMEKEQLRLKQCFKDLQNYEYELLSLKKELKLCPICGGEFNEICNYSN